MKRRKKGPSVRQARHARKLAKAEARRADRDLDAALARAASTDSTWGLAFERALRR